MPRQMGEQASLPRVSSPASQPFDPPTREAIIGTLAQHRQPSAASTHSLPLEERALKITRVRIRNFRCIREAEIHPADHNVLLGPNNSGKTTVLEAINLVLNPEISFRARAIDENDFFRRIYLASNGGSTSPAAADTPPIEGDGKNENATAEGKEAEENAGVDADANSAAPDKAHDDPPPDAEADAASDAPTIYIEAVLTDLNKDDEDTFANWLVPWSGEEKTVIEATAEGDDPFENAETAIRVFFEAWFEPAEDDFFYDTFFLVSEGLHRDERQRLTRDQKRRIGFLIYRDFRALTRPITLDPRSLFGRLMESQEAKPRRFEDVLAHTADALDSLHKDDDFAGLLNSFKAEIERFLPLTADPTSKVNFRLTDRTRTELKAIAQLYSWDALPMPLQRMGAGTRSLAILSILTLIMRRRERGILALEEPETFLFPHAQRRVVDECIDLADQVFVTTHSPYVLERIPIEGVGRLRRSEDGTVSWAPIGDDTVTKCNFYARHLRKAHCEALVGSGVIIVEGESDRWWVSGASRLLHGSTQFGRRQEALELQGVSVVSADTSGQILNLGEFFHEAGLHVACFFDKTDDAGLEQAASEQPFPCIFHAYGGLEALLTSELPIDSLKRLLLEAPHAKGLPLEATAVAGLSDDEIRKLATEHLVKNKGSAFMHEWLLSTLKANDVPHSLAVLIDMTTQHASNGVAVGDSHILKS